MLEPGDLFAVAAVPELNYVTFQNPIITQVNEHSPRPDIIIIILLQQQKIEFSSTICKRPTPGSDA